MFLTLLGGVIADRMEPRLLLFRVMGVYALMFVLSSPIGFAQTGLVTSLVGPQASIVASAIAGGVAGIALLIWLPVRKLR